jgi:hypothetical protein
MQSPSIDLAICTLRSRSRRGDSKDRRERESGRVRESLGVGTDPVVQHEYDTSYLLDRLRITYSAVTNPAASAAATRTAFSLVGSSIRSKTGTPVQMSIQAANVGWPL